MQIKPLFSGRSYYEITGDDGQKYVYTPQEFVEKGFVQGKKQFYDPVFMDKKDEVLSKASSFTLPKGLSVNSTASKLYTDPSKGVIWKAEDFAPYSDNGKYSVKTYNISDKAPAITGLSEVSGKPVYLTNAQSGYDYGYISGTKTGQTDFKSIKQSRSGGGGLFGGVFGDIVNPVLEDVGNALIEAGPALQLANFVVPGLGTGLAAGAALGQGDVKGAALNAAFGEATGNSMFGQGGVSVLPTTTGTGTTLPPATSAGTTGTTEGLLSGAGGAASTEMTAQQTLAAIGAEQAAGMTAAETLAAIEAEQAAAGVAGGVAGGATGAGAAAAGTGGLTAAELAKAGLVSGVLNTAGGLLQGEASKNALTDYANKTAELANKTLEMGKFQPVGITTRFGTSNFVTDPKTGAITPSYTLSPEAKAYQDALSGMATQSLTAGQGLMNLGQQYIGESPEAVRNRYIQTQQALLAPQQEQSLAALRNRQAATGRGGLAFGATSDGMMATNPEIAAYYNSLAQTQRQLAANAETQYQNQVNFGSGLLTNATTPFTNVFSAQKGVESAAQQPLELSTNFANTVAQRGSDQARNYATAMAPSLKANYEAANYDPFATFIAGLSNDALVKYGLTKLVS
jgi:hypothetical protein